MKKIKVPEAELLPSGAYRCRVMVCGISKTFTGDNPDVIENLALKFKLGVLKESQAAKPSSALRISPIPSARRRSTLRQRSLPRRPS